ncbi:MAG: hypothetical protein ACOCR0_02260, partial [Haloferacaceae archaeon]
MTKILVDATTLIALGTVGRLDLLESFDGTIVVLPSIRAAVSTEPARPNLDRLLDRDEVVTTPDVEVADER